MDPKTTKKPIRADKSAGEFMGRSSCRHAQSMLVAWIETYLSKQLEKQGPTYVSS
ncbi:MAG: hypothetical protein ACI80I_003305 [Akkermansiaceae bacterium]|jgi:hypothetical protein